MTKNKTLLKRVLWSIVFLGLAVATISIVTAQDEDFSLASFGAYLLQANPFWLAGAFVCMVAFVYFEGHAISYLCRFSGNTCRKRRGFTYASFDIYFSAITPSATGGQPAAAIAMMKDGVPAAATTMALLMNLMMYNVSLIVLALFCFIACPAVYQHFDTLARILIWAGIATQVVMTLLFFLLVFYSPLVLRIARWGLQLLAKLRLMKNTEKRQESLEKMAAEYRTCTHSIWRNPKALLYTFFLNFMQRISHLGVTLCVFMALGGKLKHLIEVFTLQGFAVLGSNSVPVPGAVGVADYMFINGFTPLLGEENVIHMVLLTRGISFYSCLLMCGITILLHYVRHYLTKPKKEP